MGIKKIKVEVEDTYGNKYSFTLNPPINRQKVAQFIDLVEMLSGPTEVEVFKAPEMVEQPSKSKFERLLDLIKEKFPLSWFSSVELQIAYEEKYREPISLSTVSTYLSRYHERGLLLREGPPNMLRYRLRADVAASQRP